VTANLDELTKMDHGIVGRALVDLQRRGFCIVEARDMLLKLRARMVDPADGEGEFLRSDVLPENISISS
jgi:hypothetical protein